MYSTILTESMLKDTNNTSVRKDNFFHNPCINPFFFKDVICIIK